MKKDSHRNGGIDQAACFLLTHELSGNTPTGNRINMQNTNMNDVDFDRVTSPLIFVNNTAKKTANTPIGKGPLVFFVRTRNESALETIIPTSVKFLCAALAFPRAELAA